MVFNEEYDRFNKRIVPDIDQTKKKQISNKQSNSTRI